MNDLVHTYSEVVRDPEGRAYAPELHAQERIDGIWETWLEFRGIGRDVLLRTNRESEQANRRAVLHWASGLQPSYFDGALLRMHFRGVAAAFGIAHHFRIRVHQILHALP